MFSLRFLPPLQYIGCEWTFVCGDHIIEKKQKNSKKGIPITLDNPQNAVFQGTTSLSNKYFQHTHYFLCKLTHWNCLNACQLVGMHCCLNCQGIISPEKLHFHHIHSPDQHPDYCIFFFCMMCLWVLWELNEVTLHDAKSSICLALLSCLLALELSMVQTAV